MLRVGRLNGLANGSETLCLRCCFRSAVLERQMDLVSVCRAELGLVSINRNSRKNSERS
jgi:hypothetical protein